MGFQYYKHHEWWRDDNRTYRPRKKQQERDYFYQVAKRHGFDANPRHFQFSDADIIGTGTKASDWMLRVNSDIQIYDEQQIIVEVFTGYRSVLQYCTYRALRNLGTYYGAIYVLKSDYDWTIQEKDCDIEELI